ncbi:Tim44-like domain-containing protein [Colletotrichum karsti]|uniref:Mitochondrial import inner membrane translocase subunit TIM44 n=1 Tax=Colletotrichum karsti TaxID=1095194 RepID=A0A9P6LGF4_9PEZI|nr:Tim44-like domain-containing protein [Colletotrichum karsti]KAF9871382.1 Tim44-like domain-containing protein [Colletotrichum karsti]
MNSLVQSARRNPQSASLLRASARAVQSHGRTPAHSRLLSTELSGNAALAFSRQQSTFRPTPLRSQFLPEDVRFITSSMQARSFHLTARQLQQQQTEKPKAPEESAKPTEEAKPKEAESEAKEESSEKKQEEGEKTEGEQEGEKKKEKKEDLPPPPPHGDKTPWQVFTETMQAEFSKSKEWNESTKALSGEIQDFTESERVRKAREAYEKSTGALSSAATTAVKSTAGAIGKGAAWTWDTSAMKGVRKVANVTGEALDKATKPIRDTEAYKNVKDVIDDGSSSRYGGWVEKEERRKKREAEQSKNGGQPEVFEEDPNAGTNVTLHKDAAWKEAWRDFKDSNKFAQGFFNAGKVYRESENPLIETARLVTDKIGGFFAENETAQVIKRFRSMDPNFQTEPFLKELREYILPEVLDAYVKGDVPTLKLWLSEAQYSVYEALTKQYLQAGLKSDGKILDIRHVDIVRARMLDPGEIPVFVITCRTQEVHVYRNAKSGELAAGMEDKVQLVTYAIGITRVPDDVSNPETRGWRLIEMQKSGKDYY